MAAYICNAPAQESLSISKFETLSQDDGLSAHVITAVENDGYGFLWIGTQRGLNRYSSVGIRVFERNLDLPHMLIDDDINDLLRDPHDPRRLWVGTENGGLSFYDPLTEGFENFTQNSSSISSNRVLALFIDTDGVLWVGTDAGLNRFDQQDETFEVFRHDPIDSNTLAADTVRVIFEPESTPGKLWIGTTRGLSILDISREVFYNTREDIKYSSFNRQEITAIEEVMGTVWLGTYRGSLYRYANNVDHFEPISCLRREDAVAPIRNLSASRHFPGVLWVGTYGQGLFALDTKTLTARQYSPKNEESGLLSGSYITGILEDVTATLWVATRSGLNKASLKQPFEPFIVARDSEDFGNATFRIVREATGALYSQSVLTIYSPHLQPEMIWLSLMGEGIWRYHRITNEFHHEPNFTHQIDIILALSEDRLGNLWIAGINPNLFLLDRQNGTVLSYPLSESQELVVHQLFEMDLHPNILWIATRDLGLMKFDTSKRAVVAQYSADSSSVARLGSNYVMSVTQSCDDEGVLLIATTIAGLNLLDTRTDSVTVFTKSDGSLVSDAIIAVASVGKDQIWLGTYGDGLIRFDLRTRTSKAYTREDGLPDKDVSAIFVDSQERLWLSTSNGLSRFDPKTETFSNFKEEDGLQSNIFHYQAHHQNASGEILLGGTKGFNIFHPDSILVDGRPSNVVITNLLVDGKPYPLVRSPEGYEAISLSFLENDLRFEFAVLDLRQPQKNRYKVKLDGAEDDWRKIGNQPYERYPLLAPGSYTFRVIGANSDGDWNTEGASISFKINPPFWATWWFRTVSAASLLILIIGFYQYRLLQLKRLERTRKRIADDLHDDLGSELSSRALEAEMFGHGLGRDAEHREQFFEIAKSVRKVVDDLRDVVWIVDAGHDDLAALVERMKQVTADILRGTAFDFQKPETLPTVSLTMEQRRHLFLMYKEMLHNVMRHAQASHVEIETRYAREQFSVQVRDDGVGFDPAKVRRGRGLKTLQTRASLLKGTLEIDSKPGEGTTQRFAVRVG